MVIYCSLYPWFHKEYTYSPCVILFTYRFIIATIFCRGFILKYTITNEYVYHSNIYIYILLNEISIEEYAGWVFYFTVVYNIIYTHTEIIYVYITRIPLGL